MGLQLDWTDSGTGATYTDAYATIKSIKTTKQTGGQHVITAIISIYKDSTAKTNGKAPVATTTFLTTKTYTSTDTASTYRNILNQIYNDMKDEDPWDDATDV